MEYTLRPMGSQDMDGYLEIYNHYVKTSPVTFDLEPVSAEDKREFFASLEPGTRHQGWVAESEGRMLGFAYSQQYRKKPAYDSSVEVTIYLAPGCERQGLGRALYTRLFDELRALPIHRIYAGVTMPNDASVAMHKAFGFEPAGVWTEVGFKFDRYWDVSFWELKV